MSDNRTIAAGAAAIIGVCAAAWLLWPGTTPSEPEDTGPRWDGSAMAPTGAATSYALDRMEGVYTLPDHNLPDGATTDVGDFVIEDVNMPRGKQPKGKRFFAGLPFNVPDTAKRFKPPGMQVFVGDTELSYTTGAGPNTWRIQGQQLVMNLQSKPEPGAVRIVYPDLMKQVNRLSFARSEMADHEFVQYDLLIEDTARPGLLLPAPATAEWDIKVPPNGRFSSHVALIAPPLKQGSSDGLTMVLSVVVNGKAQEVGKRAIVGGAKKFEPWKENLSEFAGQDVTLRIQSKPGKAGNTSFDYAFVAAPSVTGTATDPTLVRRIINIGMDTTRPDHFGVYGYDKPTSPEIDAWAEHAAVFENNWAPAPRTRPSFRTSTTGRYPLQAVGAKNIGEVFHDHGWATGGYVANIHLNPRFDFDHGFDVWHLDVQANATQQVDRALAFLDANKDRDTYLFLHIMDPHLFYKAPDAFNEQFVSDPDPTLKKQFNRWEVYKWAKNGQLTEQRKRHMEALYDAEIAYMSSELGRLFSELDAMPGQNSVVMHSDHGEEFWEHGGYEHNHTLYNEVTKTVLMIRPPLGTSKQVRVDTPVNLVDIAPTLYELAGFEVNNPLDGHSLLPLMRGESPPQFKRDLPVAFLRYDKDQWGVIHEGHKYILHTGSGVEELYNLEADPGELEDLATSTALDDYRHALGNVHEMPVGPGWRIRLNLRNSSPMRFKLPKAAKHVAILDPELVAASRANQAWGEPPKQSTADVGSFTLSDDKTVLDFTPGPVASGVLLVIFADETPGGGTIATLDGDVALETFELTPLDQQGTAVWEDGNRSARVVPGIVMIAPPDEATRMRALAGNTGDAAGQDVAELCALGYLHGEICEKK
jgi:arylsulfatase A-like enzyme